MTSQLPQRFIISIKDLANYPENLVRKSTYPDALRSYKTRLDEIEKKLFVAKEADVNVPFRDLIGIGPGCSTASCLPYRNPSDMSQLSTNTKYTMMKGSRTPWWSIKNTTQFFGGHQTGCEVSFHVSSHSSSLRRKKDQI